MSGTGTEIASLWIGGRLSWLEQLCLKSFADAGHRITLFSYEPIENLPSGVYPGDAREVYDPETILRHTRTGSPAIHADVWRLHLMAKTDLVWVDADVYCRQNFDGLGTHIFGYEKPGLVCNAVLRLPKTSPALAALLAFFEDPESGGDNALGDLKWGDTGPKALTQAIEKTGEISHAAAKEVFYPISFRDRNKMLLSRFDIDERLSESTRAVHFWARRLKPRLAEKMDNRPRRGSYLDGLLKRHEISPSSAPIPGWRPSDTDPFVGALKTLHGTLSPARATRIVDIGPAPATQSPYRALSAAGACHVTGFDARDDVIRDLSKTATDAQSYRTEVVADGQPATLHHLRLPNLTSLFRPHRAAVEALGRSLGNIEIERSEDRETRRLDDLVDTADLLKIDASGAETLILAGAARFLQSTLVVIARARFYRLYEGEPMLGELDVALRNAGFTLHKMEPAKTKVLPTTQIDRLQRAANRNQWIEADAIYIRDPMRFGELTHDQLRHLALLAAGAIQSIDLALLALDTLHDRGMIPANVASDFVANLPGNLKKG